MGNIEILCNVPSRTEGFDRTLRIFTPDLYDRDPHARFGVLYMQDGQNVFAHPESARFPTWCANHILEDLIEEGRVGPWMIVAVDHSEGRFEDYSPWDEPRVHVHARGDRYARYLMHELKPWVDRHYRTRTDAWHTAVMGSSLGGLISLYMGWRYPEVFGRIGALSPSVMWSEEKLFEHWNRHGRFPQRIYMDAGAEELFELNTAFPMNYGEKTRDFHRHLKSLGYSDDELCLVLEPGGRHFEGDWQRRLPFALRWLLG